VIFYVQPTSAQVTDAHAQINTRRVSPELLQVRPVQSRQLGNCCGGPFTHNLIFLTHGATAATNVAVQMTYNTLMRR